jgi:hypothetical protein
MEQQREGLVCGGRISYDWLLLFSQKLFFFSFFFSATDEKKTMHIDNEYSMKTSFPHALDWAQQRNKNSC